MPNRVPTTRGTLLFLLGCVVALTALPASPQTLLTTVATGSKPVALAVNPANSKIYVANQYSNNVTVIDEATYSTATIPVGALPTAIAVNPATNKIYVANQNSNNVTVIDGASDSTALRWLREVGPKRWILTLSLIKSLSPITCGNSVTAINGLNNSTFTIPVGDAPRRWLSTRRPTKFMSPTWSAAR